MGHREESIGDIAKLMRMYGNDFDDILLEAKKNIKDKDKNTITLSFGNDIEPPYKGWTLISDNGKMPRGGITFELISFLKDNESSISGDEMIKRAQEMGCDYNQQTAEIILKNQDKIPKALRKFYIVFTGTVWQDSYGYRRVPSLYWHGERWILGFDWLGGGGDADDRFLCSSK